MSQTGGPAPRSTSSTKLGTSQTVGTYRHSTTATAASSGSRRRSVTSSCTVGPLFQAAGKTTPRTSTAHDQAGFASRYSFAPTGTAGQRRNRHVKRPSPRPKIPVLIRIEWMPPPLGRTARARRVSGQREIAMPGAFHVQERPSHRRARRSASVSMQISAAGGMGLQERPPAPSIALGESAGRVPAAASGIAPGGSGRCSTHREAIPAQPVKPYPVRQERPARHAKALRGAQPAGVAVCEGQDPRTSARLMLDRTPGP